MIIKKERGELIFSQLEKFHTLTHKNPVRFHIVNNLSKEPVKIYTEEIYHI